MASEDLQGFQTKPARISHVRRFCAGTFIDKGFNLIACQRGFIRESRGAKTASRRRRTCKDFRPAKTCKTQEVT